MSRPPCCRRVSGTPLALIFKPLDGPACEKAEVVLTLDEFEAIRLSDYGSMYQEQAAEHMNVSRATFGRILESARKKLARMLVSGLTLRIEGGPVCTGDWLQSCCRFCDAELASQPQGPVSCLACRASWFEGEAAEKCDRLDMGKCQGRLCWRLVRVREPSSDRPGKTRRKAGPSR